MLRFELGVLNNRLSSIEITREYIRNNDFDDAVNLIEHLSWSDPVLSIQCISIVFDCLTCDLQLGSTREVGNKLCWFVL